MKNTSTQTYFLKRKKNNCSINIPEWRCELVIHPLKNVFLMEKWEIDHLDYPLMVCFLYFCRWDVDVVFLHSMMFEFVINIARQWLNNVVFDLEITIFEKVYNWKRYSVKSVNKIWIVFGIRLAWILRQ